MDYKGILSGGQANNALIYPGHRTWNACFEAKLLTDEMIGAAARSLSSIVDSR